MGWLRLIKKCADGNRIGQVNLGAGANKNLEGFAGGFFSFQRANDGASY